jgi:hypothetical protein
MCLVCVKGCMPIHGAPSPPICVKVVVCSGRIQVAM